MKAVNSVYLVITVGVAILSNALIKHIQLSDLRSHQALHRRKKVREKWSDFNKRISDRQFRRLFRMNRDCFYRLCSRIIAAIGEKAFKSEEYIHAFLENKSSIYEAHKLTSGGFISGEVKVAVMLRVLSGGDVLDISLIFDIESSKCTKIFQDVLKSWIIDTGIGGFDLNSYFFNDDLMKIIAQGFSVRSSGIVYGAIGALDGWIVQITKPSWRYDFLQNISGFFSRKGFYALNLQCLVDDKKRFYGPIQLTGVQVMILHVSGILSYTTYYQGFPSTFLN